MIIVILMLFVMIIAGAVGGVQNPLKQAAKTLNPGLSPCCGVLAYGCEVGAGSPAHALATCEP